MITHKLHKGTHCTDIIPVPKLCHGRKTKHLKWLVKAREHISTCKKIHTTPTPGNTHQEHYNTLQGKKKKRKKNLSILVMIWPDLCTTPTVPISLLISLFVTLSELPGRAESLVKKFFKDLSFPLGSSPVSAWGGGSWSSPGADQGHPAITISALGPWASCRGPRENVSFPVLSFLLTLCRRDMLQACSKHRKQQMWEHITFA